MRRLTWRAVAVGLAAASFGLSFAACGDDGGTADGGGNDLTATVNDLGGGPDLTAEVDAAPEAKTGQGQVIIADVVGTGWQAPTTDGGAESPAPYTHTLLVAPSFPDTTLPDDFSNFGQLVPGSITGCMADRYDLASATGRKPTPDVNAGAVTITGYRTPLMAVAPGQGNGTNLLGPAPSTVACANAGGSTPYYGCAYTQANNPLTSKTTGQLVFPIVPASQFDVACSAAASGAGCSTVNGDCNLVQIPVPNVGNVPYCEQGILNTFSSVHIEVAGGAPYGASTSDIGNADVDAGTVKTEVPGNVRILSIKLGDTELTHPQTVPTLDDLSVPAQQLDGSKDLSITWSCDGSTTPGGGCKDTSTPYHLVGLAGVTSLGPRYAFHTPDPQFGRLTCFEQATKNDATLVVKADAIKALIGDIPGSTKQSGGSVQLVLLHILGKVAATTPRIQLHAVGHGQFGIISLP